MLEALKNYLKNGFSTGFNAPMVKDDKGEPSATLWFAYASFTIAIGATIYFIVKGDPLASTATAISFWAIAMVFYRLKNLDKFKVDFDDKSIELEGDDDDDKKSSKE